MGREHSLRVPLPPIPTPSRSKLPYTAALRIFSRPKDRAVAARNSTSSLSQPPFASRAPALHRLAGIADQQPRVTQPLEPTRSRPAPPPFT
ncbi:hypothetical protein LMH87_011805 [Akanthomyces muscarius]|uniref:Uncharacterized protein n=1 Tax=Akanthomyces muscarius TaxID=2231603 RepID=A0A9W8QCH1_AKAMU|nr:hypothetical protein LMH87_011805 [Akanthomyces muscarius]KAJ4151088.1 hypothetical protein LMH87_011805 [Akanthomyces muscarius]